MVDLERLTKFRKQMSATARASANMGAHALSCFLTSRTPRPRTAAILRKLRSARAGVSSFPVINCLARDADEFAVACAEIPSLSRCADNLPGLNRRLVPALLSRGSALSVRLAALANRRSCFSNGGHKLLLSKVVVQELENK